MILRALRHVGFAFWLGALALVAGGLQQGQLSTSVVTGAFEDAAMMKRMGHTLAQHQAAGGHTHKGHADCQVCGATDALAFLTVSVPPPVSPPLSIARAPYHDAFSFVLTAAFAASYSSRGPPILLS